MLPHPRPSPGSYPQPASGCGAGVSSERSVAPLVRHVPTSLARASVPTVTLDEIDEYATSLAGCKRKGHPGRVAWYVDDRLVVRQDEPGTVLVMVGFEDRERLLDDHPDTFGLPPRWEKHMKVQADLDGDADAIRTAIRLAWAMQKR